MGHLRIHTLNTPPAIFPCELPCLSNAPASTNCVYPSRLCVNQGKHRGCFLVVMVTSYEFRLSRDATSWRDARTGRNLWEPSADEGGWAAYRDGLDWQLLHRHAVAGAASTAAAAADAAGSPR